jgi:hypothetical protein
MILTFLSLNMIFIQFVPPLLAVNKYLYFLRHFISYVLSNVEFNSFVWLAGIKSTKSCYSSFSAMLTKFTCPNVLTYQHIFNF